MFVMHPCETLRSGAPHAYFVHTGWKALL